MSTTVSYKGNTIATLNNETKTLTTGGTWVEADIQITDTSSGGTAAISVVDTTDSHGGTVRTITGLDISDTTAVASDVASGKYFYTSDGTKAQGTASGGSGTVNLQARTNINPTTSSQTITADSGYDGLSSVQINAMPSGTAGTPTATKSSVSNHSITVTPSVTNTTGYITGSTINGTGVSVTASELASGNKEITSNGNNIDVVGYSTVSVSVSSTPSATQHTIYFEFSDETDTTITAYYDSTFISDAITATTPTTYGQKTVTLAQLDSVTWYEFDPSETWETLYDGYINWFQSEGDYPYCWISELGNVPITVGSVYRVTYNNVEYRCTAKTASIGGRTYNVFGNPKWADEGGIDDGSDVPFLFADYTAYGAWSGGLNVPNVGQTSYYFKIEHLVTS